MKMTIFFSIILFSFLLCQAKGLNLESGFDLDFTYDGNILNLSDDDQQEYDIDQIETCDDLIIGMKYKLTSKNYLLAGHTQFLNVGLDYRKYLENEVCDNITLSAGIKQYFHPGFSASLQYDYTPEIFLQQYESVIDENDHAFEYGKNNVQADLQWDFYKNLELRYQFEYSQLFYNKWFTEYDSDVITNNLYLTWKLHPQIISEFRFAFRSAEADAEEAYSAPVSQIKDASYDGNIYELNLKYKRFFSNLTLNLGYKLEDRFFSSNYESDTYHYLRDDYLHKGTASIYIPLAKELNMILHSSVEVRDTRSPEPSVIKDKEYNTWNSGISLSYDLKH